MSDKIIQLNKGIIKQELSKLVMQTEEQTLNELLDQEADVLTNAKRYERSEDRVDTRAGSYDRKLLTKAGEVTYPEGTETLHLPFLPQCLLSRTPIGCCNAQSHSCPRRSEKCQRDVSVP